MTKFSIFQQNNLFIGTHLAAELSSSSSELRSFVVVGSYIKNVRGASKPSNILNRDHSDLRFWIRQYEIDKKYMGSKDEVSEEQLARHIFKTNIENMEQLEDELEKYLRDFSLLKTIFQFHPMLPFC